MYPAVPKPTTVEPSWVARYVVDTKSERFAVDTRFAKFALDTRFAKFALDTKPLGRLER